MMLFALAFALIPRSIHVRSLVLFKCIIREWKAEDIDFVGHNRITIVCISQISSNHLLNLMISFYKLHFKGFRKQIINFAICVQI